MLQEAQPLLHRVEAIASTPVVVLTGLDYRDRGIQMIQGGAQDY